MNRLLRNTPAPFALALAMVLIAVLPGTLAAQSLGNAGTIIGRITDPSGAVVPGAIVTASNPVTGYSSSVRSNSKGEFRVTNLPPNPYHLSVSAAGFAPYAEDATVRNALPIEIQPKLALAGSATTVQVESHGADLVENDPSPSRRSRAGLLCGRRTTDQRSAEQSVFDAASNSAIQSMELITGASEAEFGDKTSLVDQITTRSGLGANKQFGSIGTYYGTFGSVGGDASYGFGTEHIGNFIALDGTEQPFF
jgi:hypothetical protein